MCFNTSSFQSQSFAGASQRDILSVMSDGGSYTNTDISSGLKRSFNIDVPSRQVSKRLTELETSGKIVYDERRRNANGRMALAFKVASAV